MTMGSVLDVIPDGLRVPLLSEYQSIIQNFSEHRWSPSELSGGKFCEIVHGILDGQAKGTYAASPSKPNDFVSACRALESNANAPRSFQILIPRLLPALYEVRNRRGVGHVGGDVDPNHMDATFVVTSCNWIMAELVRFFHNVSIRAAQELVDNLVERRVPLIWEGEEMRRVLEPKMTLNEQIILLVATSTRKILSANLMRWMDYDDKKYFRKLLRALHRERIIELSEDAEELQILPPGSAEAAKIVQMYAN